MDKISRQEAKNKGLKKYYTGVPCHKGHVSQRHVGNGDCVECRLEYQRSDIKKKRDKKYRGENAEALSEWKKLHYLDNRDRIREQHKEYYRNNRGIFKAAESARRNINNVRSYSAFKKQIQEIYTECTLLNSKLKDCVVSDIETDSIYHVDHIVPLVNDKVSGLHSPTNLRIITAYDNLSKSNKFTPYWENHLTGEIVYGD